MQKVEQKKIRLTDFGDYFTRLPGETRAEFIDHLFAFEHLEGQSSGGSAGCCISALMKAMRKGAKLPPIVVTYLNGEYLLQDGWHRTSAAAALGRKSISAIVFQCDSWSEVNLISTVAFELSAAQAV